MVVAALLSLNASVVARLAMLTENYLAIGGIMTLTSIDLAVTALLSVNSFVVARISTFM